MTDASVLPFTLKLPSAATVGALVRTARRDLEESQKSLGRRTGLRRSGIRAIEAGAWPLSAPERIALGAALGIQKERLVSVGSAEEDAAAGSVPPLR